MHKSLPMSKQNASENLLTMSSREIADLVDARHDSVKRTIERLADKGGIVRPPMVDEPIADMLGRARTESVYHVGKRDSYVIVAQLCPEFTARLVDRWQELESQQQAVRLPRNFAEALRDLADTVEQNQVLLLENRQQSEHIHSLENYFQEGLTPPQFVKGLNGVNCQKINDYLRSKGWLYKDNSRCWRVFGHVRNKYLTEQSKRIEIDPVERIEMNTYKPVLLEKGAVKIFEFYMKGELPMRTDWDGKYYHSKVAV